MRIGLLGGSFDPIHWGHILPTLDVLHFFHLDYVLFLPAKQPPHKPNHPLHNPYHRVSMVAQAIAPFPRFLLEMEELLQPPGRYTIDTVKALKKRYPGEYFLIIGSDNLAIFHTWKEPEALVSFTHLVVLDRPGYPLAEALQGLPPSLRQRLKQTGNPLTCPHVHLAISATEIRNRVKEGKPIHHLVPPNVVTYIRNHGLYQP